jgi:hypothetical protein
MQKPGMMQIPCANMRCSVTTVCVYFLFFSLLLFCFGLSLQYDAAKTKSFKGCDKRPLESSEYAVEV